MRAPSTSIMSASEPRSIPSRFDSFFSIFIELFCFQMRVEIVHESCKDLIGKHVIFDGMILYSPKQIGDGKGVSPIFYSLSSLYRVFSIIQPLICDFSDQVPSSDTEWKFGLDMRRLFVCTRIASRCASRIASSAAYAECAGSGISS